MRTVQILTGHFAHDRGRGGFGAARAAGGPGVAIEVTHRRAAPAPRARQLATGLAAPIADGRRLAFRVLTVAEAGRGFSAGNGYLTGLMVDRLA